MELAFKKASEVEIEEIYELAGVNRREATNCNAEDNRERMIEAYEHSAKYNAYFVCLMDGETLLGWVQIDKAFDYLQAMKLAGLTICM